MAPERIVGGDYSYASDLWSVGLCFATCALGKIPLPQADGYWAVVRAICDGDPPQLDPKDGHDAQLCDAPNACLRRDASSRPTAQQLLDHPFVRRGQSIYAAAATKEIEGRPKPPNRRPVDLGFRCGTSPTTTPVRREEGPRFGSARAQGDGLAGTRPSSSGRPASSAG